MIGMVYVSRDTLHPLFGLVCIKRMMGSYMAEKNIFPAVTREVQILKDIRGIKGCIQLQNIIYDKESLSLVFPYYPKGDLYTWSSVSTLNTVKEGICKVICKQLVESLIELHRIGIIHRDLKPENILVGKNF